MLILLRAGGPRFFLSSLTADSSGWGGGGFLTASEANFASAFSNTARGERGKRGVSAARNCRNCRVTSCRTGERLPLGMVAATCLRTLRREATTVAGVPTSSINRPASVHPGGGPKVSTSPFHVWAPNEQGVCLFRR